MIKCGNNITVKLLDRIEKEEEELDEQYIQSIFDKRHPPIRKQFQLDKILNMSKGSVING